MTSKIIVGKRGIGEGRPTYIVAEMSANHNKDLDRALELTREAKKSGADAIKTQTYLPDSITIPDVDKGEACKGTIWEGQDLYDLYCEAYMPMDWQYEIKKEADRLGLDFFSTAFSSSDVGFLEELGVPVHKIASFELTDIPLIETMSRTGKPLIMSTGMASVAEIEEAVMAARSAGQDQIALLKCTSAYPAPVEEMDLKMIPWLSSRFSVPVGISDHSKGIAISIAAVAIGACIVERHFTISRDLGGPDSAFSLEPEEMREMIESIRDVEKALGGVRTEISVGEAKSRTLRRSLYVVLDVKAGEMFSEQNVRSIRPAGGLHPRHLKDILGKRAIMDLKKGTPFKWEMIQG